jgi:hypothetical protein
MTSPKRALIVSPHFPPVSAPDMQRVRMSLPYFEEFGWQPSVLAVAPDGAEVLDPLLAETIPEGISVDRVRAMPSSITRLAGVGNVALRALPFLYRQGSRLIATRRIDLVYFSTTMFLSMPLGRLWKKRFGVPYVLDFQDPWVSDYYEAHPTVQAPRKYGLARRVHALLEPWTMKEAAGVISVSPGYIDALRDRYPGLAKAPCITLPFGAAHGDFELIARRPQPNRHFASGDGHVHGVYAGVAGDIMATALEILFRALKAGLVSAPELFSRVLLHFVGTSYAPGEAARKTVEPMADRVGVLSHVTERTARVPYFEALQLLRDADFLFIIGSDDPSYTASKLYPYILARKPLLALVHERSTVADIVRETDAGFVVTFSSPLDDREKSAAAERLAEQWARMLAARAHLPSTNWTRFERYTAREMTRRQCELFDDVVARRAAAAA